MAWRPRLDRSSVADRRVLLPVLLLLVLGVMVLADRAGRPEAVSLPNPDREPLSQWNAALAALPSRPLVLVGMDPDLGTYPEIRAVTRAVLADLAREGARLAFISFTPDGRAVAAAELARLRNQLVLDAGFVAGAEAGLVLAVSDPLPDGATGAVAEAVADRGGGMAAFDAVLIVGGSDFGPRPWVEQVGPRIPDLPLLAIAPSFTYPELAPYLRTGQLKALLATVRDGAAYVSQSAGQPPLSAGTMPDQPPPALAMLAGMLVALVVVVRGLVTRGPRAGEADAPDEGDAS
ncbi:MAG TPA: hypothetical protein VFH63_11975 [candidate division Zixibacteria bacterium]|nr:hypothetical protein [candidate division Zixibacteria bacterium]